jgi:hypothetical protein
MRWILCMAFVLACGIVGCTAESTRLAIQTQRRVDDVQQEIFSRQHDGLRVLLFRDAVHRMNAVGEPLNETQMDVLNTVWNERDLLESWAVQNERAMGLRRVGVDLKLYGEQAMVDLLGRQLVAKGRRAEAALAQAAGAAVTERAMRGRGAISRRRAAARRRIRAGRRRESRRRAGIAGSATRRCAVWRIGGRSRSGF